MKRNRSKTQFWTTLALVNLLMVVYPVSMLLRSDTDEGMLVGVIALGGIGLILAIADIISVLLAYSPGY